MKKILVVLVVLASQFAAAQFIKEKSLNLQVGYGVTVPYYSVDEIVSGGFFLQGELVLKATSWFEVRPYAGLMLTKSNGKNFQDAPSDEMAETKAFLLGGKVRVRAPIPYVAPYAEIGIGTSVGKFETKTYFSYYDKSGVIYHIPFSFGLELGRNNNVDVGFTYYFHPSVEQLSGAFAVGVTIPLKN